MELDGYDLIGHIIKQKENVDRTLFWRAKRGSRVRKAVRDGDMKYHIEYVGGDVDIQKLTNIAEDPKEAINLLDSMPDIARTLHDKILKWEEEVEAPRLKGFSK
jgi:arylsulfatase A